VLIARLAVPHRRVVVVGEDTEGHFLVGVEAWEIQRDTVRYGEMWGDLGRSGEVWGDTGRCGEVWGDIGRCAEMWADVWPP